MIIVQLFALFFVLTSVAAAATWPELVRHGSELAKAGDLAGAREAFRRALASDEARSLPPEALATVWSDVGVLSHELELWPEALEAYRRAEQIIEEALGADDPRLATILLNVATVHLDRARFAEANRAATRAAAILERQPAAAMRVRMRLLLVRSGVLLGRRDDKAAEALLQQVLAFASGSPEFTAEAAAVLNNLAVTSVNRKDVVAARMQIERALSLLESLRGDKDPQLIRPLLNLAHVATLEKRHAEAVLSLRRALDIADAQPGMSAAARGQILDRYAAALHKAGRKEEARQASALAKAAGASSRPQTIDVYTLAAQPKQ